MIPHKSKMTRLIWMSFLLMFCSIPFGFSGISSEEAAIFEKANESYRNGQFAQAADMYEGLSEAHPANPAFYFNLGNALYRQGKIGLSLLAYERALVRDPRNNDIRANLKYVRGSLEYVVEDKRNWYIKTGEVVLNFVAEREVYVLFLLTLAMFLATWLTARYKRMGQPWGWRRKVLLVFMVVLGFLAAMKTVQMHIIRDAVVVVKQAEVRYGPSIEDQVAFRLGEGLKVYVIDSRKTWSRVWLVNGTSGWMQNAQIQEV